jgi:hypothetical protein
MFGTRIFLSWTTWKVLFEQMKRQAFINSGAKAVFIATGLTMPNPVAVGEDASESMV